MTVDIRAIPLPLASDNNINVMPKVEPDLVHLGNKSPIPGTRHDKFQPHYNNSPDRSGLSDALQ